ncbi:MAG: ABC transporter ATP-binding protein [Gemmatimonadaceae bacterium]
MSDTMSRPVSVSGQALQLDCVAVQFGDRPGLDALSLTVAAGERVVVVGPSGVGKTSLLRAVAGLAPIRSGYVHVGTNDVTDLPPERRGVVYLHQSPVMFSHLSVADNVAFPLRVRGGRGRAVDLRVRTALAAMRLASFERRATHTLSGGQRHRVALARAIAARPAALLLDEPLSTLDPTLRDEVREAIITAQAEYGPAMILVTHDLDDAGLLADRIAVLLDGRIAQIATPAELFSHPATLSVARFLGVYQQVPGHVRAGGAIESVLGVLPGTTWSGSAPVASGVVVAVRAEGLRLGPSDQGTALGHVVAYRPRVRGATVLVAVDDGDGGLELEALLAPGETSPQIGERVGVSIDQRHALIFRE